MKARVDDVHDSHGLVFTLRLEKSGTPDDEVIDFLLQRLKGLVSGEYKDKAALYVYRIALGNNQCALTFVESSKLNATVDYHHNPYRPDGKFTVLVVDRDKEGASGDDD